MRKSPLVLLLAGAATAALLNAAPAAAQREARFAWHGRIPAGQSIEIKGINGYVHATAAAAGAEVQVTARKHARRGNPADVKIQVVPHAGGVTICAVYPSSHASEPNQCLPGARGRSNTRDNDVQVDFDVKVPAGVRFLARTVNGDIRADNLASDVNAHTVNGGIRAIARGIVQAKTVNGGISVTMGRTDWSGSIALETVNGGIQVTLPANASVDVEAATVNGGLSTDFPLTILGRFLRNRIHGTIGQGGRQLRLKTVNGAIDIRKAGA